MDLTNGIINAALLLSDNLHGIVAQDVLLHHRPELELAFHALRRILGSSTSETIQPVQGLQISNRRPISPSASPYQSSRSSEQSNLPPQQEQLERPTSSNAVSKSPTDSIQAIAGGPEHPENPVQQTNENNPEIPKFMQRLDRSYKAIQTFLSKNEEDAIAKDKSWTRQVARMNDIDISERRCAPSQKFRGWMARYLYADDYLKWAQNQFSCPRTSFLILDVKDADNRGKGHIKEYQIALNSEDTKLHRAIKYGLKYHAFESIYGSQGVSAILSQIFTPFRNLPYAQLEHLAHAIHQSPQWSDLAERKAGWLSNCLSIYDKDCANYDQTLGRKHLLQPGDLSEQQPSKRIQMGSPSIATAAANANNARAAHSNQATHISLNQDLNLPCPVVSMEGFNHHLFDPLKDFSFNSLRDFDPLVDFNFNSLQDFDPLEDFNFNSLRDFDPLEDFNFGPLEEFQRYSEDEQEDAQRCSCIQENSGNNETHSCDCREATQLGDVWQDRCNTPQGSTIIFSPANIPQRAY